MATHSSNLTWKIPWMEEPGVLQSMGSQTVGPHCATSLTFYSNSPLLPWGILNPSTRGTVCVSKQMALFFASFPGQGVRDRGNTQRPVGTTSSGFPLGKVQALPCIHMAASS